MPQRKREFAGITAIVLGGILSVYGGVNLGRKVEWWASFFTDKIDAVYDNGGSSYSLEELKQESKQIKRNFYIVVEGLTLVLGGAVIAGTRERDFCQSVSQQIIVKVFPHIKEKFTNYNSLYLKISLI